MSDKNNDFCTDCHEQKRSRRWIAKIGLGGAAAFVGGFFALNGPGAVHDATAKDYRPLTDGEWDLFFADERNGISQLQEPSAAKNYPTLHVPEEFWLGEDANLVKPENRADAIAFETARVEAFKNKDRAWYDQHAPVLAPTDQKIASASAHFCGSGPGSYQYSCALQFRQTRTSSTCGGGYSCWGYYHCSDGHSSYCRIFCGPCSM
jgi:hypothetical protein